MTTADERREALRDCLNGDYAAPLVEKWLAEQAARTLRSAEKVCEQVVARAVAAARAEERDTNLAAYQALADEVERRTRKATADRIIDRQIRETCEHGCEDIMVRIAREEGQT